MSGFDHPEVAPRLLGAVTVALTGAAGALDAVTFFAYNEVFASTMTGNLILLGLDVGRGRWLETAEALCAIGGYTAGLALGTVIAGLIMRRLPWRSAVGVALTVELGLLVALGLGYYGFVSPESDTVRAVLLVAGGAVAMTVLDADGLFVARRLTDDQGRYELLAPRPGLYTVICSPVDDAAGVRPHATTVSLHREPVVHDFVLDHGGDAAGGT